ERFG
ncbi:hypothetical protein ECEC1736_3054, partial [Escherichia coli EC1736]